MASHAVATAWDAFLFVLDGFGNPPRSQPPSAPPWSKCRFSVEPHWRHLPPSLAATAIFTSCGIEREFRSPTGASTSGIHGGHPGGARGHDGQVAAWPWLPANWR